MKRAPIRPPTRLELARRDKGFSMSALANAAHVSVQTIWRAERHLGHPGLLASLRMARALGTSVEALWDGEEES